MKRHRTFLFFIGLILLMGCSTPSDPIQSIVLDYYSSKIGTLKYIPAGRFKRDATDTNISVITQPFRMSQYEITRSQFYSIMGTDPSITSYSIGINDPVQNINWYHAIAFCNKLSLSEGLTPVYTVSGVNFSTLSFSYIPLDYNAEWNAVRANWANNGYRLPSEMEWMWAAMGAPAEGQGGKTSTTGYMKAFAGSTGSHVIGDYAVFGYSGNETGRTTRQQSNLAGSKFGNELDLYDMSGNVSELTWDKYGAYPAGTLKDYRGADAGAYPVSRGGSWNDYSLWCSVASRSYGSPHIQNPTMGIRVVRR